MADLAGGYSQLRVLDLDGRVVSNFIVQALTSQPITLYGEGTQTRSFCYVDDLIDALVQSCTGVAPASAMW